MNLTELVEQVKKGEMEAKTAIYNHFFEPIFRFIYFRVSHKETAEDLTEEVFIKAFVKIGSLKNNDTFSAWLYQIAKNKIVDHYRRNTENVDIFILENVLEYRDNTEKYLDAKGENEKLLSCVSKLPQDQRLVVEMKFFEELDNSVIAGVLGKSEGAVRVIQHRALQKLKILLEDESRINR